MYTRNTQNVLIQIEDNDFNTKHEAPWNLMPQALASLLHSVSSSGTMVGYELKAK